MLQLLFLCCSSFSINHSFDLQLANFGVDTAALKDPSPTRIFNAWLENWEKPLLKKNCPVVEARLLEKYKGLAMYDPDVDTTFIVHDGNLEFCGGRGWDWCLIGNHPSGNTADDKPYLICEESIGMIVDAKQPDGVAIVHRQELV